MKARWLKVAAVAAAVAASAAVVQEVFKSRPKKPRAAFPGDEGPSLRARLESEQPEGSATRRSPATRRSGQKAVPARAPLRGEEIRSQPAPPAADPSETQSPAVPARGAAEPEASPERLPDIPKAQPAAEPIAVAAETLSPAGSPGETVEIPSSTERVSDRAMVPSAVPPKTPPDARESPSPAPAAVDTAESVSPAETLAAPAEEPSGHTAPGPDGAWETLARERAIMHAYEAVEARGRHGESFAVMGIGDVQVSDLRPGAATVIVPLELSRRAPGRMPRSRGEVLRVILAGESGTWEVVGDDWQS